MKIFIMLYITEALPKSLGFIFGKGNVEIKVSYMAEHLYCWGNHGMFWDGRDLKDPLLSSPGHKISSDQSLGSLV